MVQQTRRKKTKQSNTAPKNIGKKEKGDWKLTRAKEFLGLRALHGPLLLKLQYGCSEDPLDLL